MLMIIFVMMIITIIIFPDCLYVAYFTCRHTGLASQLRASGARLPLAVIHAGGAIAPTTRLALDACAAAAAASTTVAVKSESVGAAPFASESIQTSAALPECDRAAAIPVVALKSADVPCASSGELLLVCGSFYILKDVRAALGLADPSDDLEAAPVVPTPTGAQKAAVWDVMTP